MDFTDEHIAKFSARIVGATFGVAASMIMIAPEGTRNAMYRGAVGLVMGVVFAPVTPNIPGLGFLAGSELDFVVARSAATGFTVWFILEAIARTLSTDAVMQALSRELLKRGKNRSGDSNDGN